MAQRIDYRSRTTVKVLLRGAFRVVVRHTRNIVRLVSANRNNEEAGDCVVFLVATSSKNRQVMKVHVVVVACEGAGLKCSGDL
jgi:ketopantoate hydroxymethyltransferase